MLRLLDHPDQEPPYGWRSLCTPLGAAAHMEVNSLAEEMCSDWYLLINGRRHFIAPHDFAHWFGSLLGKVPVGLSAELLMANNMVDRFATVMAADQEARAHILALPDHCFGLDEAEWRLLGDAVDIARAIDARLAARAAAWEASGK